MSLTYLVTDPYGHDTTECRFSGEDEAAIAAVLLARLLALDYEIEELEGDEDESA